ncbi:synaptotagmin-5-like [Nothobranchius furzeri]|uniref:synaptotagmin-5 n=1 Tax=Nothobranchius furzeri TaxID=105023 RepID=UPI002404025D|nr:synaptotagmin-5 [Nothobranchius furzeri]
MLQETLGVHLQILLAVGLAVLCYGLVLGCIVCCRRKKRIPSADKEAVFLASPPPPEEVTVTLNLPACTQPVQQQYEELDGEVLEFPYSKSSFPSHDDLTTLPFEPEPNGSAEPVQSSLPMRRFSSPAFPSKAGGPSRFSLSSLTKLNLVSRTRQVMGRRRTVSGDALAYDESRHLTRPGEPLLSRYGSHSLSSRPAPLLHFSLLLSSASCTLVVNILSLSGDNRRRGGVFVRASLPPLYPTPQQIPPRRRSLGPDLHSQNLVLQVGSVEELQTCTLRLAVYSRDFSGLREAALGVMELACEQVDWQPDTTTTYSRQLSMSKAKLKKSVSSLESPSRRKSSVWVPQTLGQLLVLLQYQAQARRLKVMVRKAENLVKVTQIPGNADHYIVINLRQDGKIVDSKETKGVGGPNPVWNAPFLFDLPPGDITQLSLTLEFLVMQGRLYTKSSILGRVLIGTDASEAGREHWRDTCCPGQTEITRWHIVQPDIR